MEFARTMLLKIIGLTSGGGLLITLFFLFLMRFSDSGPQPSAVRAMSIVAAFFLVSAVVSLIFLRKAGSADSSQ